MAKLPWWEAVVALTIIVVVSLFPYSNSYEGTWFLDDFDSILNNHCVRALSMNPVPPPESGKWHRFSLAPSPFKEWIKGNVDGSDSVPNTSVSGRPTTSWTLAVNFLLAEIESGNQPDTRKSAEKGDLTYGGLAGYNVYTYHIVNLVIHLIAAALFFGVIRRTLALEAVNHHFGRWGTWIAGAVTLLWTIHPIQTETVTYIIQRAESVMAVFFLLTVYATIRAFTTENAVRSALWQVLAVASAVAGMGAKEVTAVCPIVLIIYDWVFLSRGSIRRTLSRWPYYAVLLASVLVVLYLWDTGPRDETAGFSGNMLRLIPPLDYALTQPQVISEYLKLLFYPVTLCLDYVWPVVRMPVAPPPPGISFDEAMRLIRPEQNWAAAVRCIIPLGIAAVLFASMIGVLIWRIARRKALRWEPAALFAGWLVVMVPVVMAYDRVVRVLPEMRTAPILVTIGAIVVAAAGAAAAMVALRRSGRLRWWMTTAIVGAALLFASGAVIGIDLLAKFNDPTPLADRLVASELPADAQAKLAGESWEVKTRAVLEQSAPGRQPTLAHRILLAQTTNELLYGHGPDQGRVAWWSLLVLGLLALTITALVWKPWRPWGFVGAWFYIILAPTSSVLPLADALFEHRVYLSMMSVGIIVVLLVYLPMRWLLPRVFVPRTRDDAPAEPPAPAPAKAPAAAPPPLPQSGARLSVLGWVVAVSVAVIPLASASYALGVGTYQRNKVYLRDAYIYEDTVMKRPLNARAHSNLGYCRAKDAGDAAALAATARANGNLLEAAKWDAEVERNSYEAISLLQRAISLDQNFHDAYHNLAVLCSQRNNNDWAQMLFTRAIETYPRHFRAHNGLAALYSKYSMTDINENRRVFLFRALEAYQAALASNPGWFGASTPQDQILGVRRFLDANQQLVRDAGALGAALTDVIRRPWPNASQDAIDRYNRQRDNTLMLFQNAMVNTMVRELENFRQAVRANPKLNDLGAYFAQRAIDHYRTAVQIMPMFEDARRNLGALLERQGQPEAAIQQYKEAIRLRPQFVEGYLALASVYAISGQFHQARAALEQTLRMQRHPLVLLLLSQIMSCAPDASVRNGAAAVEYATELCNRVKDDPMAQMTLALALAEAGQFERAAQQSSLALQIARRRGVPAGAIQRFENMHAQMVAGTPVRFELTDFRLP
jgi:tetratricopeptide (TPR) repeat protein